MLSNTNHLYTLSCWIAGGPSAHVDQLGGTGRTHDWQISAEIVATTTRPVFLSGGLTPQNVGTAIKLVRPFGLDLCSSVRTYDRLDKTKLREFMANVAKEHV